MYYYCYSLYLSKVYKLLFSPVYLIYYPLGRLMVVGIGRKLWEFADGLRSFASRSRLPGAGKLRASCYAITLEVTLPPAGMG